MTIFNFTVGTLILYFLDESDYGDEIDEIEARIEETENNDDEDENEGIFEDDDGDDDDDLADELDAIIYEEQLASLSD